MKKLIPVAIFALVISIGAHVSTVSAALDLSGWAWSSNIGWISFKNATPIPNLLAQYNFNAGTATDISGNGRTGTLQNGVGITNDSQNGIALLFDGTDDYVSLPTSVTGSSITLAAWVKPATGSTGQRKVINFHYRYRLELSGLKIRCAFGAVQSWNFCSTFGNTTLSENVWNHIAVTYDGVNTYRYYLNGVLDGSNSTQFSGSLSGGQYMPCIGYGCDESGRYSGGIFTGSLAGAFKGAIDDATIYNRALTAQEIMQLYQGNTGAAYGVSAATTTATPSIADLSGYAWSPSMGWLSFNSTDVASCPTDGISVALKGCAPVVNLSSGQVSGWARFLSSTAAENGGGWLQLAGTNHSSGSGGGGVEYSPITGAFSGFAWDSVAAGWVDFTAQTSVPGTTTPGVTICTPGPGCPPGGGGGPSITLVASNGLNVGRDLTGVKAVKVGSPVGLNWNIQGLTGCVTTSGHNDWSKVSDTSSITANQSGNSSLVYGVSDIGTGHFLRITCNVPSVFPIQTRSDTVLIDVVANTTPTLSCAPVPTHGLTCSTTETATFNYGTLPAGNTNTINVVDVCPASGIYYCVYICEPGYQRNGNQCTTSVVEEL